MCVPCNFFIHFQIRILSFSNQCFNLLKREKYIRLLVRRKSQSTNLHVTIFYFKQAKLLTLPQVFITPEIDPRLAVKLKDIVKRHNVRIYVVWYKKCMAMDNTHMLWFKFTSSSIFLNQFNFSKLVHIFGTGSYFSNWFTFFSNWLEIFKLV